MTHTDAPVLVYGASGHTGRFVVDELVARGVPVVAAGRDAGRLAAAVGRHAEVERRVFDLDAPNLRGAAVVVNTAGPFLDTALPLGTAAVAAGAHYLDVAAEQGAVQQVHDRLHAPAVEAGVAVVPASAFYGGLADLLVTAALDGARVAEEVAVAVWLDRWWPTAGTRRTGERNTVPRLVVSGGGPAPLEGASAVPEWDFPGAGRQPVTPMPFSEVVTLTRHLEVGELRSYLASGALADLRDDATPPPPEDASGRSPQRFEMEVEVLVDGERRRRSVAGCDIYASSAPLVVAGARRLVAGDVDRSGALAPSELFDGVLEETIASVAEQLVVPTT